MQWFLDYRRICPKVSEVRAVDLYLSAPSPTPPPNENLSPPPMNYLVTYDTTKKINTNSESHL